MALPDNFWDDVTFSGEVETPQYMREERGTTMDIVHDLWKGLGQATELTGRGLGIDAIADVGSGISESGLAQDDLSQTYGTQGRVGRVVDGIFQSLPTSLAWGAGALAGPVGLAASSAILGHGIFDKTYDELTLEDPDMTPKDKFNLSAITSFSEVGTEGIGMIIPFLGGKAIAGSVSKNLIKSLYKNGVLDTGKIVSTAIGKEGTKKSLGLALGASSVEGGTEVLNELINSSARESYGLEERPVDLVDVYLIGHGMGAAVTGMGFVKGSRGRKAIEQNLNTRLGSEDLEVRQGAFNDIGESLGKIDLSVKEAFQKQFGEGIAVGPMSLETMDNIPQEPLSPVEEITENASKVVEDMMGWANTSTAQPMENTPQAIRSEFKPGVALDRDSAQGGLRKTPREVQEAQSAQYRPQLPSGTPDAKVDEVLTQGGKQSILEKAKGWVNQKVAEEATVADVTPGQALTRDTRGQQEPSGTASWKGKESTYTKNMRQTEEVEKYGVTLPPAMEKERAQWEKEGRGDWKPNDLQMIELNKYKIEVPDGKSQVKPTSVLSSTGTQIHPTVVKVAEEAKVTPESINTPKFAKVIEDITSLEEYAKDEATSMEESAEAIREVAKIRKQAKIVAEGTGKAVEDTEAVDKKNDELRANASADHARLFPAVDFVLKNKKELVDVPDHLAIAEAIVKNGGELSVGAIKKGMPVEVTTEKAPESPATGQEDIKDTKVPTESKGSVEGKRKVVSPKTPSANKTMAEAFLKQRNSVPVGEVEEATATLEDVNASEYEKKEAQKVLNESEPSTVDVELPEIIAPRNDVKDYDARSDNRKPPTKMESEKGVTVTDPIVNKTTGELERTTGIRELHPDGTILETKQAGNSKRRGLLVLPNKSAFTGNITQVREALSTGDTSKLRPYAEPLARKDPKNVIAEKMTTPESKARVDEFFKKNPLMLKRKNKSSIFLAANEMSAQGKKLTPSSVSTAAEAITSRVDTQGRTKGAQGGDMLLGVQEGVEVSSAPKAVKKAKVVPAEVVQDQSKNGQVVRKLTKAQLASRKRSMAVRELVKQGEISEREGREMLRDIQANPEAQEEVLEERKDLEDFDRADLIDKEEIEAKEGRLKDQEEDPSSEGFREQEELEVSSETENYGQLWDEEDLVISNNPSLSDNSFLDKLNGMSEEENDAMWDKLNEMVPEDKAYNAEAILKAHLEAHGEFPNRADIAMERVAIRADLEQRGKSKAVGTTRKVGEEMFEGIKTGSDLMEAILLNGDSVTKTLAKIIKESKYFSEKASKIKVEVSTKGSFQRDDLININSNSLDKPSEWLHELIHGVTAREMAGDPKLDEAVTTLRRHLKNQLLAEKKLSQSQVDTIEGYKGDAKKFGEEFEGTNQEREYGYALVNNKEFLSQMFSSNNVMEVAKKTKVYLETRSEGATTIWKRLGDLVSKVLGIKKFKGNFESLLEATIKLSSELVEVELGNRAYSGVSPTLEKYRDMPIAERARLSVAKEKPKWSDRPKDFMKDSAKFASLYLEDISSKLQRLGAVKTMKKLQRAENIKDLNKKEANGLVRDFVMVVKKVHKESVEKYTEMHYQLMENNFDPTMYGMRPHTWAKTQKALKMLHSDAGEVGMVTDYIPNYFPRRVKDLDGLLDSLHKGGHKGAIEATFKAYAKQIGKKFEDLTVVDQAAAINGSFNQGKFMGPTKATAQHSRTAHLITPDSYKYYESIEDSLLGHIGEMTEKTAMKRFVGGNLRLRKMKRFEKIGTLLKTAKGTKKAHLEAERVTLEADLSDIEADMKTSVGALIAEELGDKPTEVQRAAQSAIMARINQQGAYGPSAALRNVGYAAVLGNFLSTITQVAESGKIFTSYGLNGEQMGALKEAVSSIGKVVSRDIRAARGEKVTSVDALTEASDYSGALKEFGSNDWTGEWLSKLLTMTGMKHMDLLGKEAMMRGSMAHYGNGKNDAKFMERFEDYFDSKAEASQVLEDIKAGKQTRGTTEVAMFEVGLLQPTNLSQTSEGYLKAGQGRLLFSLKMFMLRTTNATIRDSIEGWKKEGGGTKGAVKVAKVVASIIGYYAIMGAGTDWLKDLIKGRDSEPEDNVVNNILGFAFLNTYAAERGLKTDSLMTSLINSQLPPLRWIDYILADAGSLSGVSGKDYKARWVNLLPFIGTILNARGETGRKAYLMGVRKDIGKAYRDGASHIEIAKDISAYNNALPDGEKRLKMSSLKEK